MADQPEDPTRRAPDGLDAVFAAIRPQLLRYATRLLGNAADAEDALQDAVVRVLSRGIPTDVRSIEAWLTTAVHNVSIDRLRSNGRRPGHETMNENDHHTTPIEHDVPEPPWTRITADHLRDAVAVIEPVYREVYVLHTFEDQSYEEIARKLGINRITVGTRLSRARKKLRKVLVARFGLEDKP